MDWIYHRLRQLEDRNIDTVAKAWDLEEAYLRGSGMESAGGFIRIPVNCRRQLYDVVDITDARAGLGVEKKRVMGPILVREPGKARYEQHLLLREV